MAYRRSSSIITRASTLFTRQRPFPYIHPNNTNNDDDNKPLPFPDTCHHHSGSPLGFGSFYAPMSGAPALMCRRNMSTAIGEGAGEKIEYMADVAEVLADRAAEVVGPAVNEVAIAAADSAYPVAALQYLIDGVHNLTGCNWWASIALTTLLIRGVTIPLLINQLKSTTKLSILRPHLEEIKEDMQARSMDPKAVAEGQQRMQALFKEHGVTPFTPLKGLLFQGPVFLSFFLAISNMVEKVPSFKQGGAFWFTDLTTPDSLYIFPALTALSFWITVECNMQEGMEGNPAAKTMKKVSRVFAVVTVPITMSFPKALFCYWVTSNCFSLLYGLVLRAPGVKTFLRIPEIPVAPPSTTSSSSGKQEFSFFESMKKYVAAQKYVAEQAATQQATSSLPAETSKPAAQQQISSSAVLSQRIKNLEKQVKGKKKNKKR